MKRFRIAAIILFLITLLTIPVSAEQGDSVRSQMDASGAAELFDDLPQETRALFEELGIGEIDFSTLFNTSPRALGEMFLNLIQGKLENPLKTALQILGVLILLAIVDSLLDEKNSQAGKVMALLSALFLSIVLVPRVMECLSHTCAAISLSSDFMLAFIPVYAAIVAASGNPALALSSQTLLFGFAQAIAQFSAYFLKPSIGILLALSMISTLSPVFDFNGITNMIKKTATVTLGFLSTVFAGLLSIKGLLAGAADSAAAKGAKFLIGSFVPVVGGAVSDALGSIVSSLSLVRGATGAFGILAILLIALPVFAELLLWLLTLNLCAVGADLFGQGKAAALLRSIASALVILGAILLFNAVLLIISTALMLSVKSGT